MTDLKDDILRRIADTRAELKRLNDLLAEVAPMEAPRAIPMSTLCDERYDWKWILGGLIGRGTIGMLVADPHVGKSTLAIQMCLAFASGNHTLGWRVQEPHKALYCFAEGARPLVAERIRACCKASGIVGIPPTGFVQSPAFADFWVGSPGFKALIEANRPDFAVLDALGYFGGGYDENSAVEWKEKVMFPLRDLSSQYGTSFMLIHHQTKESDFRKGWQKGRGTSAMFADVDWWWRLESEEGEGNENKRVLAIDKNKYGVSGQTIPLVFDKPGAFFEWRVGPPPGLIAAAPPKKAPPPQLGLLDGTEEEN